MGGRGTGSILLVAIVAAVIGVATLVTTGLLPGQVANVSVGHAGVTGTTMPFALGTGVPAPSVVAGSITVMPPTTAVNREGSTPTTSTTTPTPAVVGGEQGAVPAQGGSIVPAEAPAAGGGAAPGPAAAPAEDTTSTTAAAATPPTDATTADATCSVYQELRGLIADPTVRQAVQAQMKASGC
jgi:hypothetical protein